MPDAKQAPVLRIKEGVRLDGLQPEAVLGIYVCASVFFAFGYDCVVTCGTDGDHMPGSLHNCGLAFDLRRRHLPASLVQEIAGEMQRALDPTGRTWQVIVEATHFHIEQDR